MRVCACLCMFARACVRAHALHYIFPPPIAAATTNTLCPAELNDGGGVVVELVEVHVQLVIALAHLQGTGGTIKRRGHMDNACIHDKTE